MNSITRQQLLDAFEYRDGKLFWKINASRKVRIGKVVNTVNKHGYVVFGINQKKMYAHRAIFFMHHGFLPKNIDHINGNKLDNRIENLREADSSQNGHNTFIRKNNTSGVKNVTWNKALQKWQAKLRAESRIIHLGYFDNIESAIPVLIKARVKYHGQFANNG
jgi:hypothetical protein